MCQGRLTLDLIHHAAMWSVLHENCRARLLWVNLPHTRNLWLPVAEVKELCTQQLIDCCKAMSKERLFEFCAECVETVLLSRPEQVEIELMDGRVIPLASEAGATRGAMPGAARTVKPQAALQKRLWLPELRTMVWDGEKYEFNVRQAIAVEYLWNSLRNGTPSVPQETLLAAVDEDNYRRRLRDVFRRSHNQMHPAWNKLIVPGGVRGTYRLSE